MKKWITLTAIVILGITACKKNIDGEIIKGRLVYRSCASIVVQILDSNSTNIKIAQDHWVQGPGKPDFIYVFAVTNTCSFPDYKEGDEFTFRVIKEDRANRNCVICMLWDNPPTKKNNIKVINKIN